MPAVNSPRAQRVRCCFALRVILACAAVAALSPAVAQLPTVRLTAGIHLITAELADTDMTRTRGLMFRDHLAPNHGMLFVFDNKAMHCMWMRNTRIPLSVAFLDDDGTVVNIHDMKPHDETSHCAARPVRYALEMTQGWFRDRGIKPGARIGGLPPQR
ncbi:MAG: DUF192 domain-containing protein [Burkholderiaceae bacterium]|nr:DUF192 domain-containing protein [Burkholderiaceae bacterium]MCX7901088.1 DUF192 domain-containing protein [Burkholderiaceae bacterium]